MTNKLKALGLALIAVFAMSAVAASTASAGELTLPAGATEATITGEQIKGTVTGVEVEKHEFKTMAGVVKCTPATFGSLVKTAAPKEATLTPTYGNTAAGTGCTIAGVAGPVVHMNGCTYTLVLHAGGPPTGVTVTIDCPAGQVIVVTASANCSITIGAQGPFAASMVSVTNGTTVSPMDVHASIDITGIDYTEHGVCPNGGGNTTTTTDGTYKGVVTFKAETHAGVATDLTVS